MKSKTINDLMTLSPIVLKLGQTLRITEDSEGNKESVTTHSLMLALSCKTVIDNCTCGSCSTLDTDQTLLYSLLHDLHEWKYGDFQSYRLDKSQEIQKVNLENAAYSELIEGAGFINT